MTAILAQGCHRKFWRQYGADLTANAGPAYKSAMTPPETSGKELRKMREKLGLTPTEAAASIHVSARTWQRWEASKDPVPPTAVRLFRILHGFEKLPERR